MIYYYGTYRSQIFGCGASLHRATRSALDPSVVGMTADADGFVRGLALEVIVGPWRMTFSTLPPVRVPSMKNLMEQRGKGIG